MLLKLIAAIIMLIDHIGYYFFRWLPNDLYFTFRSIGRLAFPIFAYYIALGYRRTGHLWRYFLRLLGFAVISEVIIRRGHELAAIHTSGTNILFTFAAALGFISGWTLLTNSWRDRVARLELLTNAGRENNDPNYYQIKFTPGDVSLHPALGMLLGIAAMIVSLAAVIYLKSDYGIYGVLTVFAFHLVLTSNKDEEDLSVLLNKSLLAITMLNIGTLITYHFILGMPGEFSYYQLLSILSVFIIFSSNAGKQTLFGSKPAAWKRYSLYAFYPLHIFILCLIVYLIRIC